MWYAIVGEYMVEIGPDGRSRYTADDYTEEEIENQAEYLALNTSLTHTQAEVILRKNLQGEDEPQKKIAEDLGINQSTLSTHLVNVGDKIANKNAFKMAALFGGRSPISPATFRSAGRQEFSDDGFIEVFRNQFPDANKFAPDWAAVTVRPGEHTVDEEYEDDDDVVTRMRWNVDYYHFASEKQMVATLDALVERKKDFDVAVLATALSKAGIDLSAFEDEISESLGEHQ